jgi:hypothetical protein
MRTAPLLLAMALTACAPAPPPPPPTAKPAPTVIDDQLKAIEKARAVEAEVRQAKDRADEALERSGG